MTTRTLERRPATPLTRREITTLTSEGWVITNTFKSVNSAEQQVIVYRLELRDESGEPDDAA